jgi:FAD/FMN-containing dehydrogenase
MRDICAQAGKIAGANALPWAAMVRGLGVIHIALLPEGRDEDWRNRVVLTVEQICVATANLGGNASIPWCPAEWNSVLKNWTLRREDFSQMKKLKAVFDPQSILAPGHLLGGL